MIRLSVFVAVALAAVMAGARAEGPAPLGDDIRPFRVGGMALVVSDIERSKAFYTEALGMKVGGRGPAEGGPARYYTLGMTGDRMADTLLVIQQGEPKPEATSFGRVILFVPDARKLAEHVVASGGRTRREISDGINMILDPDGYVVELIPRPAEGKRALAE
ncbi:MAG: VOC family protein [Amphiplicatus sp.]